MYKRQDQLWVSLPDASWRDAAISWWAAHRGQQPRADWRHIFSMAHERGFQRVANVSAFPPVPEPDPNSDLVDVLPLSLIHICYRYRRLLWGFWVLYQHL